MRERDERDAKSMEELRQAQKATQREIGKLGGRLGDLPFFRLARQPECFR